ncbi:MAG: Cdc6/Cdc18 family protein [Promethearchaeota archaeon]
MNVNYIEDLLKKSTIFKDETKLDMNYIPERLPYREKELSLLSQLFLILLTHPNSISRKILITGRTGIGKTVTIKLFGMLLEEVGMKRNIQIKVIHVNCRKERTNYKVLIKIIRIFNSNFPKRGYSLQDLIEIMNDYLNQQNLHLLVVLDELNYLINNGGDLVYSLTRLNDDTVNNPQRLSLIGIVRDISCLNNLDSSTLSSLQRNIIKFKLYTKNQIFDIIKYRSELSLKENTISDDLIDVIAEIVLNNGDIRFGLNLLWKSAKIAEYQNYNYITPECLRLATQDLIPFSTQDLLRYMKVHKLLLLLAIIKSLKKIKKPQIFITDAIKSYQILCENTGIKERSYSQIWNYLQEFKKENIISMKILSEKIRGRKGIIEIPEIPLNKFEGTINSILSSKGLSL